MKSYLIGRKKDSDIVLTDPSVSRQHAELVMSSGAQIVLVDCESKFGTFLYVKSKKEWERITTMRVNMDDRVKLGRHETSVKELVAKLPRGAAAHGPRGSDPAPASNSASSPDAGSPVERNPETGEIITRRRR